MPHLPDASLLAWLIGYCAVLVPLSLLGGWSLQKLRPSHRAMQHLLSVVAGLMLGIAVLHMLPHAIHASPLLDAHRVGYAVLAGMLVTFLLLRLFHTHQHEPAAIRTCTRDHDHDAHEHPPLPESRAPQRLHWAGTLLGMSVHSLMDGIALGSAMQTHPGPWPGFGVLLAVALHKPLDSMSVTGLMMTGGWSPAAQSSINIGYALLCPLGAAALLVGLSDPYWLGLMLAASTGVFLCVALADLLPEMEFHSHDRLGLTAALLAGIGIAIALQWIDAGHAH